MSWVAIKWTIYTHTLLHLIYLAHLSLDALVNPFNLQTYLCKKNLSNIVYQIRSLKDNPTIFESLQNTNYTHLLHK